jgi:hypothetical protein
MTGYQSKKDMAQDKLDQDDDIQVYKRPWVGLTDAEVEHIADSEWEEAFVRLIEAKLKENNT